MKILFVTLSNIGDCLLSLPALDALCSEYPQAEITCLVPERPKEIFTANPRIKRVVVFDKHARLRDKAKLFFSLAQEKFDLVVDLRNSFFGAFLPASRRSSPLRFIPPRFRHMKDRHLFWAGFPDYPFRENKQQSLAVSSGDEEYIDGILKEKKLDDNARLIVVAPGARSQAKRWDKHNFGRLCGLLLKDGWGVVLAGDRADEPVCAYVRSRAGEGVLDLCGKTSINQLAALLKRSRLLITNDSAIMHLAGYLNTPCAAIFGPTDENKYGPWSADNIIIKKDVFCRPCEKAACRFGDSACLAFLKSDEVFTQVNSMLEGKITAPAAETAGYRRILITRTDRIGDVVLSTPVIKALREKYPQAYIAMIVAPYARDVVDANPYLDEVIVYDKDIKHRSWWRSFKFASRLKKKKFDLALTLHPTNRAHILTFLAAIPRRLGYDRKFGFLNNLRVKHEKQDGLKHEAEYNLDLLKKLGISGNSADLFVPIKAESEEWVSRLLEENGIKGSDKLLAVNPGASCPSKIWPAENFARAAAELARKYGFKVLVLSGPKDTHLADAVIRGLSGAGLNLSGKTSVSRLASLLKRCALFISNDSGPVHIASSLGVPVISIFGRNQPGLSPRRWGPLGKKGKYLHKDVGCIRCLAHGCEKGFACLKAVSVEDVLAAAESILENK